MKLTAVQDFSYALPENAGKNLILSKVVQNASPGAMNPYSDVFLHADYDFDSVDWPN